MLRLPLRRMTAIFVCAMAGAGPLMAQTQRPPNEMSNGANVGPGRLQSPRIPSGQDSGTGASSNSVPLGTPAEPRVLVQPSTPPVLRIPGVTVPRRDRAAASSPRSTQGRTSRRGSAREPADMKTPIVGAEAEGFPAGLRDCVANLDRDERVRCVGALYDRSAERH